MAELTDLCPVTGKTRYLDKTAASKAKAAVNQRQRGPKPITVYLCRACRAWHLGRAR